MQSLDEKLRRQQREAFFGKILFFLLLFMSISFGTSGYIEETFPDESNLCFMSGLIALIIANFIALKLLLEEKNGS